MKNLIVECSCGCGTAFSFKYDGDLIYISALEGLFYSRQKAPLKNRIAETVRLLGKNKWVTGAMLTEKDVLNIIGFLGASPCSNEETDNDSYLLLSDMSLNDDVSAEMFDLTLYSTLSPLKVLCGKIYRTGEISLNEEEKTALMKHFSKVLERNCERVKRSEENVD